MIERARWAAVKNERDNVEADEIEHRSINPQLARGEIIENIHGISFAAGFCATSVSRSVLDILTQRAKVAGWKGYLHEPSGWYFITPE
jgi:hypothetical protein